MGAPWFWKKSKPKDSYENVNRELELLGSHLRVENGRVSNRNRSSRIFLNFIDFRENGILWYGVQGVKNDRDMAVLIQMWNEDCKCSGEIEERFPEMKFPEGRKKIEEGEEAYLDWSWNKLVAKKDNRFGEFIELCAGNPKTRRLMSYIQLRDFGLSSYIGKVNGVEFYDLPRVRITDDWEYEVRSPEMAHNEYAGKKPRSCYGKGNAREAFWLLLRKLPPDAGPAKYHRGAGCCPPTA